MMQSMLLMIDTLLVSPLGEIPFSCRNGDATTIVAFVVSVNQMALANGTQLVLSRAGSCIAASLSKAFGQGYLSTLA
ncbi:hypothetical protein OK016_00865 [Vibrio chagasii]|nr:hypothetical protein [Vibrio chagasii]